MRLIGGVMVLLSAVAGTVGETQSTAVPMPRNYPGVGTYVPGVNVTPVANAPFSATVDIVTHEKLPDGTERVRTTVNHIARQSSGRIYNERRRLVPAGFQGDPALLRVHIYDPNSRLNIFLDPYTHLAHESILKRVPEAPAKTLPTARASTNPLYKEEDLGTQPLGSLTLHGIRKSRTIPSAASDTGKDVVIVDEYWYSPDLSIYMIVKHNDPRTGEQIVAVSAVVRGEPDAGLFAVPEKYKVIDETPVP